MNLPANVNSATLPQTYEHACHALSECARLDECQDWTDRAMALASYARQSEDDTLLVYANRIKGRAVRRAGELLKAIEASKGGRPSETEVGDHPSFSRKQAASDAGMSPHQAKQAIRIANVPEADFEEQIESDNPPTLSKLASQGIKPRPIVDLEGRDPKAFNRALHFVADLEEAARTLTALDVDGIAPGLQPTEIRKARAAISKIDTVADRIMARIS